VSSQLRAQDLWEILRLRHKEVVQMAITARTLRAFQHEAIVAQLVGQDVVIHSGMGSGKTTVAAGPHVHPSMKGRVTIMVSPFRPLVQ
jgi:ATP-dependent helicase YprA (DUF1998 family)